LRKSACDYDFVVSIALKKGEDLTPQVICSSTEFQTPLLATKGSLSLSILLPLLCFFITFFSLHGIDTTPPATCHLYYDPKRRTQGNSLLHTILFIV
jgi:hypothetical protein